MKYRILAALAALVLLLSSCGSQGPEPIPSQPENSQPLIQPQEPAPQFGHSDAFYTSLGQSLDIVMAPLFKKVEDLTPRQQSLFFPFFVDREGLYHGGEDFYDPATGVYRIPVTAIAQVLHDYLGVEDFDPLAAYGEEPRRVDYTEELLGYFPQEGVYVLYQINGWGGARSTRLLEKKQLEDGSVQVTQGFYDFGQEAEESPRPYKRRVYTLRENLEHPQDYTLLSLVDIHLLDGEEITVTDAEDHLNLRQPEVQEEEGRSAQEPMENTAKQ